MGLPELFRTWSEYRAHLFEQVRVLVVDDDPDVQDLLAQVITNEGFKVDAVSTVEAARLRLESVTYDLVVCDRNLPGASGHDLLEQIRDSQLPVSTVLMSDFQSLEEITQAIRSGAVDYISKPFQDIKLVTQRLRRVIDRRLNEPIYSTVVDELKAALARGDLDEEEQQRLRGALFSYRESLDARVPILIIEKDKFIREAAHRTLTASGIWAEGVPTLEDLMERIHKGNSPLVAMLSVTYFTQEHANAIRVADPELELLAFAGKTDVPAKDVLRTLRNGASDIVQLGAEGILLLKSRGRVAVERARRRRLHLHLVATLYQLAAERGYGDGEQLLQLLSPDDAQYVQELSGQTVDAKRRRRHPRQPVRTPVVFLYVDALMNARHSEGESFNASHGGMYIVGEPPPLQTVVMVRAKNDPSNALVGRVIRHAEGGEPNGFAIEFIDTASAINTLLAFRSDE